MVQTFFGGFTDVDKTISANKKIQVILASLFLSLSWSKKHYGSSLTVHRDRQTKVVWGVKSKNWENMLGLL